MNEQNENIEQAVTPVEQSLKNIQEILIEADQENVYPIRTRLNGLINAYKNDIESIAILHLLMAEYTLISKIEMEVKQGRSTVQ